MVGVLAFGDLLAPHDFEHLQFLVLAEKGCSFAVHTLEDFLEHGHGGIGLVDSKGSIGQGSKLPSISVRVGMGSHNRATILGRQVDGDPPKGEAVANLRRPWRYGIFGPSITEREHG